MSLSKNSKSLRAGGEVLAWSTIGEVVGNIIGLAVPNSVITDMALGHIFGMAFAALKQLGVFNAFKTSHASDLNSQLADIEKLFITGKITESEKDKLREKCISDYQKKMLK